MIRVGNFIEITKFDLLLIKENFKIEHHSCLILIFYVK